MRFPATALHIGRLRASVPDGDSLAVRRRWERAFANADAIPAELGSEGLLVLRRVRWRAGPHGLAQLRSHLLEARHRAARPATGAVPAGAEAVWFADEAELLACLARDVERGALFGGWWWQALGLATEAASVARRWIEAPRAVPAAVETLAREGRAGAFLAMLAPASCHHLAVAVADAFALPALRELADLADVPAVECAPMPERLREVIPEPPPRLPPTALALWACCILLVRHPAAARADVLQELLVHWLNPPLRHAPDREIAPAAPRPSKAATEAEAPTRAATSSPATRPIPGTHSAVTVVVPEAASAPPKALASGEGPKADSPPRVASLPRGEGHSEFRNELMPSTLAPPAPSQQSHAAEIRAAPAVVQTAFGGIFYLLNVALSLGIYSDFTRPRGPNPALSPFDWLALLGGYWFAAEFEADPLWPALAALAGRTPTELPGLPEEIADPQVWLAREIERVHERLATGLPEPFARGLPGCVCRQDAEVCVTDQRVEVRFALATHPVALRLAGLDRDPGWLPAAGREITFHYD